MKFSSFGLLSLWLPLCFGCSDGKEAAAASERVHILKARVEELDKQIAALPTATAEQLAAQARLKTKYNATKIEFRSKEKARLGTIPEDLYQSLASDLDEVDGMIRDFPK